MKIKVIQYFIGEGQYRKLCDISKQLNSKYCQLYNYDYQFLFISSEEAKQQNISHPTFKLKFIYDNLFQDYDYIMFIDPDAAVNNPNYKIEDLIDSQHQIFLSRNNQRYGIIQTVVNLYNKLTKIINTENALTSTPIDDIGKDMFKECQQLSMCNIHHNEGLYIIKNTQRMKQFFKKCIDFSQSYISNTVDCSQAIEGRTIQYLLQLKKYNDAYDYLFDQAQNGMVCGYELKYDVDKTFIMHNYGSGLTFEQKLNYLKKVKQNKWWNRIYFKDKKFKVISYSVDNGNNSADYVNMVEVAKEVNEKYCSLYDNYDYQLAYITKQEVIDTYGECNRPQMLVYRIKYIYQQLLKQDCDYLVFLDTDAVISNPTIRFEDMIDQTHQLFLSRGNDKFDLLNYMAALHNTLVTSLREEGVINKPINQLIDKKIQEQCYYISKVNIIHNEGYYVIKNSEKMREFYYNANKYLPFLFGTDKRFGWEMRIIMSLIEKDEYKDLYTFMYDKSQSSVASGYEFSYDIDKTFIMHNYASWTPAQKTQFIEQVKKNKWWKEYFKENNDSNDIKEKEN